MTGGPLHRLLERATLALLRRVAPRASQSFATQALYIAAAPHARRAIEALADGEICRVRSGPFAGLKMLRDSPGTGHLAKILGTYETQLAPWIEAAIARKPARVINVGCGDGYYLSGMALRLPQSACFGFDTDAMTQRLARRTAELNGVGDRIVVEGFCTPQRLNELCGEHAFLIVDCEGGEDPLLDPTVAPRLASTTILIELHDFIVPGIGETLARRFAASHRIDIVGQAVAWPEQLPDMPESLRLALACENRGHAQHWMLLTPRDS